MHRGFRICRPCVFAAGGRDRHAQCDRLRLSQSAVPVLDPGSGRELDDRAGLLEQRQLRVEHDPTRRRLSLLGVGSRRQQRGWLRRVRPWDSVHIDDNSMRFGQCLRGSRLTAAVGHHRYDHRRRLRMRQPAL